MSTHEKLHQGRGVIIGLTHHDAAVHSHLIDEDEGAFVGSASPALTIQGGIGGMNVRTVYITPHAEQGLNYDVALEAAKRCLDRSGNTDRIVRLSSRG